MDQPTSRRGSWPGWPGLRKRTAARRGGLWTGGRRRRGRRYRQACPAGATVIAANPKLRERELAKLADYAAKVAEALHHRRVGEPRPAWLPRQA